MGSLSVWHWLIILLLPVVYLIPLWRIVSKAGYSGTWSLLSLVPVLNLILLWVFAFSKWPGTRS